MKKFLIGCVACLGLLTSSCAVTSNSMTNRNLNQTEVVLTKKNFKVVGSARGESTQNYWFGIGGMSKKSLNESAISDMYKNANLTGAQTIINTNIVYKNKFILIHNQARAIATGTIIEFVD